VDENFRGNVAPLWPSKGMCIVADGGLNLERQSQNRTDKGIMGDVSGVAARGGPTAYQC
jgi:hypothetical protein